MDYPERVEYGGFVSASLHSIKFVSGGLAGISCRDGSEHEYLLLVGCASKMQIVVRVFRAQDKRRHPVRLRLCDGALQIVEFVRGSHESELIL